MCFCVFLCVFECFSVCWGVLRLLWVRLFLVSGASLQLAHVQGGEVCLCRCAKQEVGGGAKGVRVEMVEGSGGGLRGSGDPGSSAGFSLDRRNQHTFITDCLMKMMMVTHFDTNNGKKDRISHAICHTALYLHRDKQTVILSF